LLRGWKLDEIEDKSSSTEKLNSYGIEGFKGSKLEEFPVKLLMRDGLLNEDRIVKVLIK